MLLLCDDSVGMPLKIIFENILLTSLYPDMWKLTNVTAIFKKVRSNLPISLRPICIIFNNLYPYLNSNNLITKNQSGYRPGDSTTNQLLFLVDEIHRAFEDRNSLEVRAVFLVISKAFDKVWHDGLIFKLKQNGISGSLLKLFDNYLRNRKQRDVLNGSCSILKLNLEKLKVLFLDHYYFLFILMTLKEISNPISIFLLMTPCSFL